MAKIAGFTPLVDTLTKKYGLVTASIWGRIWRYEQGSAGKCTATHATLAENLGISERTMPRHIKKLIADGYVKEHTQPQKQAPPADHDR